MAHAVVVYAWGRMYQTLKICLGHESFDENATHPPSQQSTTSELTSRVG